VIHFVSIDSVVTRARGEMKLAAAYL